MTTRLAYDLHGPDDAPVVVLGSSLGTVRSMWDEQTPALAQRFRVVRYDHLGHGESQVPAGPYTVDELADDLVALLDELGVARAHLAGLSLGGMVALRLAAGAPERVDRLAVLCTSAHMDATQSWLDRAAAVRAGGTGSVVDAVTPRWFTPAFAGSARAGVLRRQMADLPAEGYAGCCEAIAAMDLRRALGEVRAPTLVVAGADDLATPLSAGRAVVDAILAGGGTAHLEVLQGAAHLASVEAADDVTRLLLQHFDQS